MAPMFDDVFWWIVASGIAMTAIALVGSLTFVLSENAQKRIILPMVALAAGSMLGGALFHMIPASVETIGNDVSLYVAVAAGFVVFFCLEQFLHWHHCHRTQHVLERPLGHMILVADGLHNFIGGLAVAGAFLADVRIGISAFIAAAAHEVPQELGDFGALVHAGWSRGKALLFNLLSALTFLAGGLVAYAASARFEVTLLLPFAAGNFLYIAAADLVPEINKHERYPVALLHFASFAAGLALLYLVRHAVH